ncbi:MAG: hypothetical protein JWP53_1801 [Conexibacter sp.]|nr:hypothetical protein [Conexibacter sp.]
MAAVTPRRSGPPPARGAHSAFRATGGRFQRRGAPSDAVAARHAGTAMTTEARRTSCVIGLRQRPCAGGPVGRGDAAAFGPTPCARQPRALGGPVGRGEAAAFGPTRCERRLGEVGGPICRGRAAAFGPTPARGAQDATERRVGPSADGLRPQTGPPLSSNAAERRVGPSADALRPQTGPPTRPTPRTTKWARRRTSCVRKRAHPLPRRRRRPSTPRAQRQPPCHRPRRALRGTPASALRANHTHPRPRVRPPRSDTPRAAATAAVRCGRRGGRPAPGVRGCGGA